MLRSLTSLRFFAAMLVVLSHLPGARFTEGYTGVTFFFVLSGFILSYNYAGRLDGTPRQARSFWISRVARVYPLHFLTMLVALPAAFLSSDTTLAFLGRLTAQLSLTQAAIPASDIYFSFNHPAWSL